MDFSQDDYRLMARTFRLRAADECNSEEIERLVASARRYEELARQSVAQPPRQPAFRR